MRRECTISQAELDLEGALALLKSPMLILDTETTGLHPERGDRVLSLGMVWARYGWVTSFGFLYDTISRREELSTWGDYLEHFNPEGRQSSPEAARIHGISDEYLARKLPFSHHADEIVEILCSDDGKRPVLAGHNIGFDVNFLDAELLRSGYSQLDNPVLDTRLISKLLWPGEKGSLDALCERLGVDRGNRDIQHDALDDCHLVGKCIPGLIHEIEKRLA